MKSEKSRRPDRGRGFWVIGHDEDFAFPRSEVQPGKALSWEGPDLTRGFTGSLWVHGEQTVGAGVGAGDQGGGSREVQGSGDGDWARVGQ